MIVKQKNADVAELVDAPDLGSGFARSEGSSPFIRIKLVCEALLRNAHVNPISVSSRKSG